MFVITGKTLAFPEVTLCPKAVRVLLDLALQFLTEPQNVRAARSFGDCPAPCVQQVAGRPRMGE